MKNICKLKYKVYITIRKLIMHIIVRCHPKYDKKYKLSICAIFKDEAPFLAEWVNYHAMLGVEHFYLYNNNSTDNYKEVLNPFIQRGLVTVKPWTKNFAQMEVYKDFYETQRHKTQWVAFLDVDEFICPIEKNSIIEWLYNYDKYPAILINFKFFGTGGKTKHDYSRLVTEQYIHCWDELSPYGKSIVNTDYDIVEFDYKTNHCPTLFYPFCGRGLQVTPIDQYKRFATYAEPSSPLFGAGKKTIQLNHYWCKAFDIYKGKMNRNDAFFKNNPRRDLKYFYENEFHVTSADYTIFKYIMKLKLYISDEER